MEKKLPVSVFSDLWPKSQKCYAPLSPFSQPPPRHVVFIPNAHHGTERQKSDAVAINASTSERGSFYLSVRPSVRTPVRYAISFTLLYRGVSGIPIMGIYQCQVLTVWMQLAPRSVSLGSDGKEGALLLTTLWNKQVQSNHDSMFSFVFSSYDESRHIGIWNLEEKTFVCWWNDHLYRDFLCFEFKQRTKTTTFETNRTKMNNKNKNNRWNADLPWIVKLRGLSSGLWFRLFSTESWVRFVHLESPMIGRSALCEVKKT